MRFIRKLDAVRPAERVDKTVLPSGTTVIVEEVPQLHSLTLGIWVLSGSRDEPPAQAGISHFIEHMVFKGSRRRSALQIAKRSEAIGGQLDAFTTREHTCYFARIFEEHLEEAIEILGDLLSEPVFDREMVARERGVVVEEIESYENNPEEQAHDLIAAQVWENHPLGHPILGTPETIHRIGARALQRYHRAVYTAPNILVAASGRVRSERILKLVESNLRLPSRPAPNGTAPIPRFRRKAIRVSRDVTQATLCLAGRGPSCRDEDRHHLALVNMVLGAGLSSRLYQRIREREGLAYTVYSFQDILRDTGLFGIYLGVAPENAERALDLVCREIRKLKRDGVRRWEMESAKAQLLMSQFLSYESTYERMSRVAMDEISYGRQTDLETVIRNLLAIDRDQVHAAVERYLKPQRFSLVSLGPPGMRHPSAGDWDF